MGADVYQRLSVPKRVNGAGLLTRLGGSLMEAQTLDAMREAAGAFVDIAELQTRAGAAIARHTGTEAAIVTGGAAAALTLATAAAITRTDVAKMERLPDTEGMANEVIIHRAHRTGYDHAIRAAGARLVEIGLNDRGVGAGVRDLEAWEIEAAIGPKTAAIAYTATQELSAFARPPRRGRGALQASGHRRCGGPIAAEGELAPLQRGRRLSHRLQRRQGDPRPARHRHTVRSRGPRRLGLDPDARPRHPARDLGAARGLAGAAFSRPFSPSWPRARLQGR